MVVSLGYKGLTVAENGTAKAALVFFYSGTFSELSDALDLTGFYLVVVHLINGSTKQTSFRFLIKSFVWTFDMTDDHLNLDGN